MLKIIRSLLILCVRTTRYVPSLEIATIADQSVDPLLLASVCLASGEGHGPHDQG